ncbi:MAG: pyridoxamine 5'-phosphate oxidase family protein [Candidatus Omnitrophica bacterium]|nr:pyridoxamine 5'-phosphate oxidase family protein [Candidatus Omnitrophota bacterium]
MENQELKDKILKVIQEYPIGSIATIKDGKPWVRYMAMQVESDLTLYTSAFASSRKISQIKTNNNVHVSFGAYNEDWNLPYIGVAATAKILTDLEIKKKLWCDKLNQFFKGPQDPNYVVVKITPSSIEYMSPGAHQPEVYTL